MNEQELIPHLFRLEAGKITSVLCRQFGLDQIEMAEDIAAETFLAALESWPYKGIPAEPVAWLYAVAKNKTRNLLARNELFRTKISPLMGREFIASEMPDVDLSSANIRDSQLQMLFAICDPAHADGTQICLALRILCGFSAIEIAHALLISLEAVNKRLMRGKKFFRDHQLSLSMPGAGVIESRLPVVLQCLYLLFNEGWYSETNNQVIREDLCAEAIRLAMVLTESPSTDLPQVNALLALMCFQSSRLQARQSESQVMLLYDEQDDALWNQDLIGKGAWFLHKASVGTQLSRYHLEAMIAYYQTDKVLRDSNWHSVLQLYDQLFELNPSPVVAMNRVYAFARVHGSQAAIEQAEQLALPTNPYYHSLLAFLYSDTDHSKVIKNLELAAEHAKTEMDKRIIQRRLAMLIDNPGMKAIDDHT